ncbi:MAG: topoisomerase IV [Clostridia bacterium]|nr:topoisomerase IV [Clostridia bacterium]
MNFTEQKIADTLETNYMPYAMSVIVSRAIPEIDGFKPSHRKLLYTMYKMGLLTGQKTKSANVVGQTMRLNPHGDMAIYETMVRLTRGNAALLHPFVDSKGNFGKQFSRDMAFAASRYTEVKLDEICKELFSEIDKDSVEFQDNYDATMKEPKLLPVTFPNILVNPNEGIAVGMASKICSFNLREICEATVAYMRDEKVDLIPIIKAPDFPGGGQILYDEDQMRTIYETGRGSFKIRSKYNYDKKNNVIEITEIPYSTTAEVIIDKVIELIKAGKLKDVTDIRDETDLSGLKIAIDVKRNVDIEKLMSILFKTTTLQDTFSCNFNLLIDGMPKVLGVKEILKEWVRFRVDCVRRTLRFDLSKKEAKLHLLKGLEKILLDIDKAIKIIRETEKDALVVPSLMEGFGIDEIQANFVAEIKLRNLNKEYLLKNIVDIADLEREIDDIRITLESDRRIKNLISKQLQEISKKYGKDRLTGIISAEENQIEYTPEKYIDDFSLKVFVTKQGYIKKVSLVSLRASNVQKLKDTDEIMQEIETSNKEELLLFSNQCNVYKVKIYDIPSVKASDLGEYMANLLGLEEGEMIVYAVVAGEYRGYMVFGFEDGRTCKVPLSAYITKTNRKMLTKAYSDHSVLVGSVYIPEDRDLVAFGSNEKALVFNTSMIPEKVTRSSQGVKTFNPGKRGKMINLILFEKSGISDAKPYKSRNLPAAGAKLIAEDKDGEQLSLI